MATYQLRPLSIGEILDGALVLLRRHFGLVLAITIVCEAIPTAMDVYIDLTGGAAENPGLSLLDRLLTLVGSVLVTGATVRVVSEAYLGRAPLFGDAMRFAGSRFGTIFGANLMSGILTVLATLALVIPGIVVACGDVHGTLCMSASDFARSEERADGRTAAGPHGPYAMGRRNGRGRARARHAG